LWEIFFSKIQNLGLKVFHSKTSFEGKIKLLKTYNFFCQTSRDVCEKKSQLSASQLL